MALGVGGLGASRRRVPRAGVMPAGQWDPESPARSVASCRGSLDLTHVAQETWVQSLGQEDPLEEEMATHSNILAWRIPCTEEPAEQQSMSQRIR